MAQPGRLIGLGVGPGDPELITVKALRLLRESPVVAYFVAKGKKGNAFGIIEAHLQDAQTQMPLVYPVTTEVLPEPLSYEQVISDFYDQAAVEVAVHLDAGRDVAVICEGDPFFYGSYMYLHDRLAQRFEAQAHTRFPCSHGHQKRPYRIKPPSRQRPQASDGLITATRRTASASVCPPLRSPLR